MIVLFLIWVIWNFAKYIYIYIYIFYILYKYYNSTKLIKIKYSINGL